MTWINWHTVSHELWQAIGYIIIILIFTGAWESYKRERAIKRKNKEQL